MTNRKIGDREDFRMTWTKLLAIAARKLECVGVPTPGHDARILASYVLGISKAQLALLLASGETARVGERVRFEKLVAKRSDRFPLQYLTNSAPFRYLELEVGPGVFVPRPETELVAQLAIDRARSLARRGATPTVVDLGTGSGAIALSIATEVTSTSVYAVELSDRALVWARKNVDHTGAKNVTVVAGDLRRACPQLDGQVDVVVSNPPYIPEYGALPEPEARAYEPRMALYGGGRKGMSLPTATLDSAARLLRQGGYFVMEHDMTQASDVMNVMVSRGVWSRMETHRDLLGRARATSAYKGDRFIGAERNK